MRRGKGDDEDGPADPAQVAVLVAGARHTEQAEAALAKGTVEALQEYNQRQEEELRDLIRLTRTKLDKGDRQRVMVMITIDAHGRDIVRQLIDK